jgi:3'-phosphoadenosine 5'-phosphosulfate sulfotransferase (PAPS reductase)/FAD synthetase
MNYEAYDKILVAFSGGKDSIACFLHLLEMGVPVSKIELHHHLIDGREGSRLMDWPITESYCRAFAEAFGVAIYFSWKVGGFEGEMNRENAFTQPTKWECPGGKIGTVGGKGRGNRSTRRKYPAISKDLNARWCSAYLKIDVLRAMLNNSPRFVGLKVLTISGERGEESAARACYATLEADRSNNNRKRRSIDRNRPIRDWTEAEVWAIIERFRVRVHPCYYLGWGRCSCRFCIFGNCNQFASARKVDAQGFAKLGEYETDFGYTLQKKETIAHWADKGIPYEAAGDAELAAMAMGESYALPIFMDQWILPAGAYGESNGPI